MTGGRVLALVPARAGSKRVPGKNSLPLGDRRLVEWTRSAALAARSCDRVVLSTDDPVLLELAAATPGVEGLPRPSGLATDTAGSVDVALHALDQEQAAGREWDVLVLLQPTSPFRAAGRIDEGLDLLRRSGAPAVVGVRPAPVHPYHCFKTGPGGGLEAFVPDPGVTERRTQDFPAAFCLTGSFYAIEVRRLRQSGTFVPEGTVPLLCTAPGEEIDIDTLEDFARAETFAATTDLAQAVRMRFLGGTSALLAITVASKLIGFAREIILLETVGIGRQLDLFLVLYGIASLVTGALGICIVTSITPLALAYRGPRGSRIMTRAGLRTGLIMWLLATIVAAVYVAWGPESGKAGWPLALIVPAIVPFSLLSEYQVGLFLARGQRTPVICGNIIVSLPLAVALLVFDMTIVAYSVGLVLSFALRTGIFAWLLEAPSSADDGPAPRAPELFGRRLGHTLAGGSAMLAMSAVYVTATMAARPLGAGEATMIGYGLKIPLFVLTSVWFVVGTGFFAAIITETPSAALARIRRLTGLNLLLLAGLVASVLLLRTDLPETLGWRGHSQILTVARASLPFAPLVLFVPTIEMVQRFLATHDRHWQVALVALPIVIVGLGLQGLGMALGRIGLIAAAPGCAALAGFLVALVIQRQRAAMGANHLDRRGPVTDLGGP